MLAIWARARQTPDTCGCVPCVSQAATLANRSIQLRRPGQRASAFLGSHIHAAGLTVNAKARSEGRDQWDRALSQLKDALERPQQRQHVKQTQDPTKPATTHDSTSKDVLPPGYDWDAVQRVIGVDLVDEEVLRIQEEQTQPHPDIAIAAFDHLHSSNSTYRIPPEWPVNTGPALISTNLPPQSLWAREPLRLAAMRRRHTWKKLAIQRLSAAIMVCSLIRHAKLPRFSRNNNLASLLPQLREMAFYTEEQVQHLRQELLEDIEMLQQTPIESSTDDIMAVLQRLDRPEVPRYRQDADGEYHDISQRMNQGIIKQILHDTETNNDRVEAFAIAKICHNIFVSTAPPNLDTFNLLLTGFRKWRRPQMVDHVIAAFYAHKIRPNEVTCVEILTHYTVQSRPDDFTRFVAKMRGVDDALMLASPSITINEASFGRVVRKEQKILQKVYPTPMVFRALLHGVVHFAGYDRALDIYYEMRADGWGLDLQGLTSLLRHCIPRADWESGLYLWGEISLVKQRSRASDVAQAYQHMLSLCSVTGKTAAFNQILNEVARRGFDRKSIIDAATKLTRWAYKKRPSFAPAFTADNILIAVSDFVDDATSRKSEGFKSDNRDHHPSYTEDWDHFPEPNSEALVMEQNPTGPEEAWSTWLEHEFGERPSK